MNLSSFLWSVADLLRGKYKPHEYGRVILPFTVLRRMDCVLAPTKAAVLAEAQKHAHAGPSAEHYLTGQIDGLQKSELLYLITEKFVSVDLHPDRVSNADMGTIFEKLIRKFAELSNETAGEHFTPRDVIRLMADLLFIEDDEVLSKPAVVRTVYDPTAGTGGMLSVAADYLEKLGARAVMVGQELNDESYAICKADMLIKGQDVSKIKPGDTLANDGHAGETFDYMLSNPPFGVKTLRTQARSSPRASTQTRWKCSSGKSGRGQRAYIPLEPYCYAEHRRQPTT